MRAAVAILASSLAGCLFVGNINQPPTEVITSITLSDGTTMASSIDIGDAIDVNREIHDDQSDPTDAVTIQQVTGTPQPACSATYIPTQSGWQITFKQAGTYEVTLTPTDKLGAKGSSASVMITVIEQGPMFDSKDLTVGENTNACGSYPAAVAIPIALSAPVEDPEQALDLSAECFAEKALTYTWQIVMQPTGAGQLGLPDGVSCPSTPLMGGTTLSGTPTMDQPFTTVCLYADPSLSAANPSMYQVQLTVDDGVTADTIKSNALSVNVIGDAPACLQGEYPSVGTYVVPRDEPTVFQVVGIDDTKPASALLYTWTVERSDGTNTVVQASTDGADDGGRLSLDPTTLGVAVGETLTLVAEVEEPNSTAPACAANDDECETSSCIVPGGSCPRRAAWTLEYR